MQSNIGWAMNNNVYGNNSLGPDQKQRKKYCTIAMQYDNFVLWRSVREALGLKSDDQLARYLLAKYNNKTKEKNDTKGNDTAWKGNDTPEGDVERMVIDVDPLILDALQGEESTPSPLPSTNSDSAG